MTMTDYLALAREALQHEGISTYFGNMRNSGPIGVSIGPAPRASWKRRPTITLCQSTLAPWSWLWTGSNSDG